MNNSYYLLESFLEEQIVSALAAKVNQDPVLTGKVNKIAKHMAEKILGIWNKPGLRKTIPQARIDREQSKQFRRLVSDNSQQTLRNQIKHYRIDMAEKAKQAAAPMKKAVGM